MRCCCLDAGIFAAWRTLLGLVHLIFGAFRFLVVQGSVLVRRHCIFPEYSYYLSNSLLSRRAGSFTLKLVECFVGRCPCPGEPSIELLDPSECDVVVRFICVVSCFHN
jgi:hypothetical protein